VSVLAVRRPGLALLILSCGFALGSAPAVAQETIFDPENPAVEGADDSDDADEESGGETIFDPENPAVSGDDDAEDAAESTGPRLEPVDRDAPQDTSAAFLGAYSSRLAVDTSFDGRGEDVIEWANGLDLRLEFDMKKGARAVVEGHFWHWAGGQQNADERDYLIHAANPRASYEARLGEAYVLYRSSAWSVRVGNLVTPWGSTDIVRPGDVINPSDMRRPDAMAGGDTLSPQLTGEVTWSSDDLSLTGLIVPFFAPRRVTVFGRDSALASPFNPLVSEQLPIFGALEQFVDASRWDDVQPLLTATRTPEHTPQNVSLGARASTTQWNTDLGLGYFFGWDRTPWLHLDEDLGELIGLVVEDGQVLQDYDMRGFLQRNPEAFEISERLSDKAAAGEELFFGEHRRRHTLVADVARYVGPIGLRADVAFSPAQTLYTRGFEAVRRPTIFGALGASWERLRGEDDLLALTLEGFWLHPFAHDSPVTEIFVPAGQRGSAADELILVGDGLYGAAAGARSTVPYIDAELQLGAVATLSNGDFIANASLARRWRSWLRTTVGVAIFAGPEPGEGQLSLGGLYSHNDHVFLTVDGLF
jgi:hypothetical protein